MNPELRSLLNIASVEGELFTAEAVASIEQRDARQVLHLLSRELEGVHHLVNEQEELRVNQGYLTRYRFGHVLIQQYLYAQLGSGERRLLHAQIAQELQRLVQEDWQPFAAKLAWHWQQAGRPADRIRLYKNSCGSVTRPVPHMPMQKQKTFTDRLSLNCETRGTSSWPRAR